jgi:hypothetical protein
VVAEDFHPQQSRAIRVGNRGKDQRHPRQLQQRQQSS